VKEVSEASIEREAVAGLEFSEVVKLGPSVGVGGTER